MRREMLKSWVAANVNRKKRKAPWRIDPGIFGPGGPKRRKRRKRWGRLI